MAPSDQHAAMIEVNSETDFVAKNQKFQDFVKAVANVAGAQKISDLNALMSASLDSGTVEDSLKNLIAVIGENMTLRRVTEISVGHGVVATYIHSAIAPGLGKSGSSLHLSPTARLINCVNSVKNWLCTSLLVIRSIFL